jgi:hypothetical protein
MNRYFCRLCLAFSIAWCTTLLAEGAKKWSPDVDWESLAATLDSITALQDDRDVYRVCDGLFIRMRESQNIGKTDATVMASVVHRFIALSSRDAVRNHPEWIRFSTALVDAGFVKLNAAELKKNDPASWQLFGALGRLVDYFEREIDAQGGPDAKDWLLKLRPPLSGVYANPPPAMAQAVKEELAKWEAAKPVIQRLGYLDHALLETRSAFRFLRSRLYPGMTDAEVATQLKQHGFSERAAAVLSTKP